MSCLSLCLLGPPQVLRAGAPVTSLESNKVRALLVYLAVEADRPQSRDALIGLLWPDLPDAAARHNLRQALANLRQALGDHAAQPPFLLISREAIQFNCASDYDLDILAFTTLLAACDRYPHRRSESCTPCARRRQEAVRLYRGSFLAGFFLPDSVAFEEWVLIKREWVHRLALDALRSLAAYHERRGEYEQAHRYAVRQVELEPWREEAHRQVMRALFLSGQRGAALAQYERCRAVLAAELGVEPEAETTALYQCIRAAEDAPGEADAFARPTERPNNLPAQPTPFIGRETELAELADLLANPACRLLTIVGPGGIGKTRLALQAATEQLGTFAHGVFFIPLAPLNSSEFLVPAIAGALAFAFHGPKDPKEQLLAYLREKELLLVLDNFEHLLDGAGLLAEIIQHVSAVTLLVTSRERLALRAEWLFDLAGLLCPPVESTDPIETYSAARLFLQCARQVRRQFALVEEDARAVARICRLVEGLPLAIELTAAAVREQPCTAIAIAIETAMQVPEAPWRDVPERHRSLRAVFDHSWRLLSEEERGVLRRLSVFRSGCLRDAAEQVAGASLPLLSSLIDKSLLRRNAAGRYDLHELIRQYADERLREAGETEQTQNRHAAYFLALAEAAEPELYGPREVAWLERLEAEHDNLRAALGWALERGDVETSLRLGAALWRFWEVHGHLSEGRSWLERAIADCTGSDQSAIYNPQSAIRAKALNGAGRLAWRQCDYARAQAFLEASLAVYSEIGDRHGVGDTLHNFGIITMEQGDYTQGQAFFEASLALRRELGNRRGIAATLNSLGIIEHRQGNCARAQTFYEEGLALFRKLGDKTGIALSLNCLGGVASDQGDYVRAQAFYGESLALFGELGSMGRIAECLESVAKMFASQGRPERAARLFGAAAALNEAVGQHMDSSDHVEHARDVAAVRAQLDEATFAAAWAAGRAMTLEQAISEALGENT